MGLEEGLANEVGEWIRILGLEASQGGLWGRWIYKVLRVLLLREDFHGIAWTERGDGRYIYWETLCYFYETHLVFILTPIFHCSTSAFPPVASAVYLRAVVITGLIYLFFLTLIAPIALALWKNNHSQTLLFFLLYLLILFLYLTFNTDEWNYPPKFWLYSIYWPIWLTFLFYISQHCVIETVVLQYGACLQNL